MAIDQTPGAAPIFLGLPLITSDAFIAGDITCTDPNMQALRNRLYQLDTTAPCASVGSAGTETIIAGLWVGATQFSRQADCVFILNMNLVRFKVEYSNDNGLSYTTVPGADFSGLDYTGGSDFVLFLASPITLNKIKLTMYDAFDKTIGTFDCALTSFQTSRPLSRLNIKPKQTRKEVVLADGTSDQTYFEWSDNSYTLNEIDSEFEFVAVAGKSQFDSIFAQLPPFLYYPEPGDSVRGIFLSVLKKDSYSAIYQIEWKGRGYKIRFTTTPLGFV